MSNPDLPCPYHALVGGVDSCIECHKRMREFVPRKPDAIDAGFTLTDNNAVCLVDRDGLIRPEVTGPHPHPLLVVCSESAAKRGKRARVCGCPECWEAFDGER